MAPPPASWRARRLEWSDLPLADVATPAGPMRLTRSLTSGLTRREGDPPGVFWGVGDRGPNIKPGDAAARYGLAHLAPLAVIDGAKVMPLADTGPALARFRLHDGRVELEQWLPLRTPDGKRLPGVAPPALAGAESEPVYGLDGTLLPTDPDGADTEGVAALPDGRFWIAEEYGPSLLLVGADGTVQRRLVPAGMAALHADSTVPTSPALPAIAAARKLNRGFEALALTSDGGALAVMFQSPLAHPDRAAHEGGDVVRLWLLDAASGALIAEHAYPLDPPEAFRRDCAAGPVARSDIKVSEIAFAADGSLLVLERVTRSTRIHRVTLDPATRLPARMADPAQRPTLEQLGQSGAAQAGLPLLAKTLVLSTDDLPEVCVDLEGLLVLDDGKLLLSNDSDYGIEGAETQFWLAEADEG